MDVPVPKIPLINWSRNHRAGLGISEFDEMIVALSKKSKRRAPSAEGRRSNDCVICIRATCLRLV
jgi:hypothetical protein